MVDSKSWFICIMLAIVGTADGDRPSAVSRWDACRYAAAGLLSISSLTSAL